LLEWKKCKNDNRVYSFIWHPRVLIFFLFQVTYQDLPVVTICPEGSWAEVDPLQLLSTSIDCIILTVNNLKQLDIDPEDIVSIGLTNQVRGRCLIT